MCIWHCIHIGQHLCHAVSEGEFKWPKHVLICVCQTLVPKQAAHDDTTQTWPLRELWLWLELEPALGWVQDEVPTYLMPQTVTEEGNIALHCESDNLNRTTTNVHGNNIVNSAAGIILSNNLLPTVQVIDKNKLRWFGHVMRREEESMLRIVMKLKMKGKRPRGDQDEGG